MRAAPLSQWVIDSSYNSAAACAAAKDQRESRLVQVVKMREHGEAAPEPYREFSDAQIEGFKEAMAAAKCIGTDDLGSRSSQERGGGRTRFHVRIRPS